MENKDNHTEQKGWSEDELNKTLEALFNDAVSLCLRQIKGEITEETRIDRMKKLDQIARQTINAFIERTLQEQREEMEKKLRALLRKGFKETNTYSEVQQEIAWYNDGIRDAIALIKDTKI